VILDHDYFEAIGQHAALDDLLELGALPLCGDGRQSHGEHNCVQPRYVDSG
jgi:hypothetical protein